MKNKKFTLALIIFSLTGQIAWVVENMYFNVFIYKMFAASARDISVMVGASAAAATLTTVFIGALSDKIGKRKVFICGGYILWGVSILSFAFIREDVIVTLFPAASASAVGVTLVIIMDCVMTFFGSSANDAAFNAWLTDSTDSTNRGSAEGINAMMPLVAILAVFGGFMSFDLDRAESWTSIYIIIGTAVFLIGILGVFLIDDNAKTSRENKSCIANILYGFRASVIKNNPTLYLGLAGFAVFGISIQVFMPYLILYYSVSLGMENYVLIMAPAIIIAAAVTVLFGKLYDKKGYFASVTPALLLLGAGYVLLYFFKGTALVFLGSLLMMCGYLSGMAVFGALIRDHTPENKAGMFQGLRIVGQVLVPGTAGAALGAFVLRNAEKVMGDDGRESFIPNENIFAASFLVLLFVWLFVLLVNSSMKKGFKGEKLYTEWGETLERELSDDTDAPVFDAYPRPLMKRESYFSLNGKWELEVKKTPEMPVEYTDSVIVPFAPEAALSGTKSIVTDKSFLFYKKRFILPKGFNKGRVLLHFGAVDRECTVYINGKVTGSHKGGYTPFYFDITELLENENTVEVAAYDTLDGKYPYGKQSLKRGGMWYTAVSGIWQSVWVESVPQQYITELSAVTEKNTVTVKAKVNEGVCEGKLTLKTERGIFEYPLSKGEAKFTVEAPLLWSPESPKLYDYTVETDSDKVSSYFAFRTLEIKEVNGLKRLCLNGRPYFFHGLLDQGYFSDTLFLPASPGGFEHDISRCKELGFNMLRKHIKIEPQIFYSMCDRMGMAVFQDMVNNGSYSFVRDTALPTIGMKRINDKKLNRDPETRRIFEETMKETVKLLSPHPSVCLWTVFNEGWGQFCGNEMYAKMRELDSSRFIDTASGWFRCDNSDVESLHVYFKKLIMPEACDKPVFLSEFGGYSYKEKGHVFNTRDTYGYRFFEKREDFENALERLYKDEVIPAVKKGLCAAVYTQISDVEDETNGLFTYDRRVCKVEKERMTSIANALYGELSDN